MAKENTCTIGELPIGTKFNFFGYPMERDRYIVVDRIETTWNGHPGVSIDHAISGRKESAQGLDRRVYVDTLEYPFMVMPPL